MVCSGGGAVGQGKAQMSNLNDQRVLFAAERTLLAWNRTSIYLMSFGFVVERFGLFLEMTGREEAKFFQRQISFYVGLTFILLAASIAFYSIAKHRKVLRDLNPEEFPKGYSRHVGILTNGIIGVLGLILCGYLFAGFV